MFVSNFFILSADVLTCERFFQSGERENKKKKKICVCVGLRFGHPKFYTQKKRALFLSFFFLSLHLCCARAKASALFER